MLKILMIFFSLSIRTPNNQEIEKKDFEMSGGMNGTYYSVEAITEREDNLYFKGLDFQAKSPSYKDYFLESQIYIKEARDINDERLSVIKDISPFYMGTTLSWMKWEDPAFMTLLAIRIGVSHIEWQTNFKDREIFSLKLGKRFPIRKKVFLEPLWEYKNTDGKKFVQFKLKTGITF